MKEEAVADAHRCGLATSVTPHLWQKEGTASPQDQNARRAMLEKASLWDCQLKLVAMTLFGKLEDL